MAMSGWWMSTLMMIQMQVMNEIVDAATLKNKTANETSGKKVTFFCLGDC